MFSGRYPSLIGPDGFQVGSDIPQDIPLIASWLSRRGYDTFGIPGPGKMSDKYGYGRGFDTYLETYSEIPSPTIFTVIFKRRYPTQNSSAHS